MFRGSRDTFFKGLPTCCLDGTGEWREGGGGREDTADCGFRGLATIMCNKPPQRGQNRKIHMAAREANFECVMTRPAGVEAARSNLIESCAGLCSKTPLLKGSFVINRASTRGVGDGKGGRFKPKAIVRRSVKRGLIKKTAALLAERKWSLLASCMRPCNATAQSL